MDDMFLHVEQAVKIPGISEKTPGRLLREENRTLGGGTANKTECADMGAAR